jgi:ABC-type multidrug transport system fused ATPase/permease subunit
MAFFQFNEMFWRPIRDLSEKYNIMQTAMASSERVFKLLDDATLVRDPENPLPLRDVRGDIEFRNVWFSYHPSANGEDPAQWVLRDVSFTIRAGETVAIVGHTGAGKTTIISLLTRFYDIQRGEILIDGVNIAHIRQADLRRQLAVVLQDVFLFSGTVMDNICLRSDIPPEKAIAAARVVSADFVEALPGGYETEVKERGATLSVGERQLLSYARALAFDPKILVLDEATASIDSQTESVIQASLRKLLAGRTSIAIAHRLSTIRESDRILVLHHGEVVEEGTHEALLEQAGLYAALYALQFADGPRAG